MAENRSHKDALAICQRSGIETLKSKLVRDGFIRGMWVLPEYYEPPQFLTRPRPKPELPPFNPAPLIDTYLTTQELIGGMQFTVDSVGNVPYVLTAVGRFLFESTTDLLIGEDVVSYVGDFAIETAPNWELVGVLVVSEVGQFGEGSGYGLGAYGEGPYGGISLPGFDVGFHMPSVVCTTDVGTFEEETGYGVGYYGYGAYGGSNNPGTPYGTGAYGQNNFGGTP